MNENFGACLKNLLLQEGGWSDNPRDPGGATMKGVTIGEYKIWKGRDVSKDELRHISDDEVAAIYKKNYWDQMSCDSLPDGTDAVIFDFAVNAGVGQARRTACRVAGLTTYDAASVAQEDAEDFVNKFSDARANFYKSLSTFDTFGKGWLRRVEDVRAFALSLVK